MTQQLDCRRSLKSSSTDTFLELWKSRLTRRVIEYNCAHPKHEFLQWLVAEFGVVLHGSNHRDLEVLVPQKATGDPPEQSLNAVYATTDGAEAIFFAVLDRGAFRVAGGGSFTTIPPEQTYAVSREVLERKPWGNGCVYIFERQCEAGATVFCALTGIEMTVVVARAIVSRGRIVFPIIPFSLLLWDRRVANLALSSRGVDNITRSDSR